MKPTIVRGPAAIVSELSSIDEPSYKEEDDGLIPVELTDKTTEQTDCLSDFILSKFAGQPLLLIV